MSSKTVYSCDHCGAECSGDEWASIGRWDEPKVITFGMTIHGCSKEHLGFALAKLFGIGVDGKADELLNRNSRELAKLTDANVFLAQENEALQQRIDDLQAHTNRVERMLETSQNELVAAQNITDPTKPLVNTCPRCGKGREAHGDTWCSGRAITDPTKPTKPAIDGHEAYIEARMQYQRVAGGTAEEMGRFWQENRERFQHDERMVMANGDIVRDMEFES